jgi:hypothetical protein
MPKRRRSIENNTEHQLLAMRDAILDDVVAYKASVAANDNALSCAICQKQLPSSYDAHVDHVGTPFRDILNDFLRSENTTLAQVLVAKQRPSDPHAALLDDAFKQRWYQYHKQRARYRILCLRDNNSSFATIKRQRVAEK